MGENSWLLTLTPSNDIIELIILVIWITFLRSLANIVFYQAERILDPFLTNNKKNDCLVLIKRMPSSNFNSVF